MTIKSTGITMPNKEELKLQRSMIPNPNWKAVRKAIKRYVVKERKEFLEKQNA